MQLDINEGRGYCLGAIALDLIALPGDEEIDRGDTTISFTATTTSDDVDWIGEMFDSSRPRYRAVFVPYEEEPQQSLGTLLLDFVAITFAVILMFSLLITYWPLVLCFLSGIGAAMWAGGDGEGDEFDDSIQEEEIC